MGRRAAGAQREEQEGWQAGRGRYGAADALVALAAAPENVVLAAQLLAHVDGHLGLGAGVGVVVQARVGRGAVLEARVREQVLRGPEQLHVAVLLVHQRVVTHLVQQLLGLRERGALRGDVDVVERVVA